MAISLKTADQPKETKEAKEFQGFTQTRILTCRENGGCLRTFFLSAFFVFFGHPTAGLRISGASGMQRALQRLLGFICSGGWPAKLAHRLGLQQKVKVQEYEVVLAQDVSEPIGIAKGHARAESLFGNPIFRSSRGNEAQISSKRTRPLTDQSLVTSAATILTTGSEVDFRNAAGPKLRIVFASDFHAGPVTHPRVLRDACLAMRRAEPDLLLLGGDFVSFRADNIDLLVRELSEIPAPLGKFAVLGNHDHWSGPKEITRKLEMAGISVLTNRNIRLPAPYDLFWLCGMDDSSSGLPDPELAFAGADGMRIVLMHSPSGLIDMKDHSFSLALCGHTHGGQIALPGGIPMYLPKGALCRRYASGRFALGKARTLLVSRGVGYSGVPFRLFSPPEILVCNVVFARTDACNSPKEPQLAWLSGEVRDGVESVLTITCESNILSKIF